MRTFTGLWLDTNLPFRVHCRLDRRARQHDGGAYNNDLDLTVNIGGQTYLGNVFSGAWSVTGGSADATNNVESVFLSAGVAGAFTVIIAATSINSIGVPNGSNG